MARPGEQAPVKPNRYSEEEIAALAAFVASLGPGPDIPTEPTTARPTSVKRTSPAAAICSVPIARHATTSKAGGALPNGKYAPPLAGLSEAPVRGDGDRTSADAGLLRRGAPA